ncbi:hypothetical protein PMG71_01740 [Roseofilum sp. BLCC_M154]|uniref:Uncharacterized protein n=1 Tax=Roseofilum acuticapitatum BLCC-M154 TaxID=3022444 RepID=A0ABT7AMN2_9CYAN|nr:hypothetical protein [Roseofilum acuticapitatum]MDJ1168146.1 hypothetical protein [Roseofilum acuticapitatum BLCC-M154]
MKSKTISMVIEAILVTLAIAICQSSFSEVKSGQLSLEGDRVVVVSQIS